MRGGAPIVAVTCLSFEARIASGPGVTVLCGNAERLAAAIEGAIAAGSRGIISFGIAGGLKPNLPPGAWVVASKVLSSAGHFFTHRGWSRRLLRFLPGAVHAEIVGVDAPVMESWSKRELGAATGGVAVDMESHVAARIATARGLPFAACRVIIDPVDHTLPQVALRGLRGDGRSDPWALARALASRPAQVPALVRTALAARCARNALIGGRRLLGAGFGFPELGELQLDVA